MCSVLLLECTQDGNRRMQAESSSCDAAGSQTGRRDSLGWSQEAATGVVSVVLGTRIDPLKETCQMKPRAAKGALHTPRDCSPSAMHRGTLE